MRSCLLLASLALSLSSTLPGLGQTAPSAKAAQDVNAAQNLPSANVGQPITGATNAQIVPGQAVPSAGAGLQSVSLADALAMTQQRSFVSQQFDARVVGAAALILRASALQNPVFSIAAHVGKDTGGTDEDYLISQTFELGDKYRQRVRAARLALDAAKSDRLAARNDLVFNVQSAYYEALRADANRQLAQNALDNARKYADAAQLQFTAGDVARSQVTRSRIALNQAEQALAVTETERVNRFAALRSLTRMPDTAQFRLSDTLNFTPPSYKLADLQVYALAHRPDLQSAEQLRASRDALLHGARVQSQPDLFLEARHGNIDPNQGGNSARVGVLFPLYDFGRNRADVAAAKSSFNEQDAILAETRRVALLDVETAYRNLQQARSTVESFRGERLNNSRELLDQAQLGYSQGANTFLELLDAQQVYRTEQTDYTRALADYNIALAALQRAVGGTLP